MRLTFLFVTLLGLSVVACSLATWGITYAFSYTRLTTMAADFSAVTAGSVEDFGRLILSLIDDSSQVIKGILGEELVASEDRINATEAQVSATSLDLIGYARNETDVSRADLQDLVDGFGTFMHDVIEEFEHLAVSYASQMRQAAAGQVRAAFNGLIHERILAMERISRMYEVGLIDLDRDPEMNITAKDCSLLAMVCDASNELGFKGFIFAGLATGAHYSCNSQRGAFMATSRSNATHSTQGLYNWPAYPPDVPAAERHSWRERCLSEVPQFTLMGVCPLPQNCQCGYRSTCRAWYQSQVGVLGPPTPRMTDPFFDAYYLIPLVSLTYPIYNSSSEPRQLLAVAGAEFYFQSMNAFLENLTGPYSMRTAVVLNDTALTTIADSSGDFNSASDTNLSLADNPDPAFQAVAAWLSARRRDLANHTQVELGGVIWDLFSSNLDTASYFVLVGMEQSEIFGTIVRSETEALKRLQALQQAHLAKLAVSEARTRSHMEATQRANLQQLEAMKATVHEQLARFRNTSQVALGDSEAEGRAHLEGLLAAQRQAVVRMLARHLSVLTGTIGWSIAVVVGVFVSTLLVGVYGTLSITKGLQLIIRVMEDVAHMKVEALDVPGNSSIAEVQRIQVALGKLVGRLAHYKSFMPAGLFPERQSESEESRIDAMPTPRPVRTESSLGFSHILPTAKQVVPILTLESVGPEDSVMTPTQTRITKRNVVAMVVNIVSFNATLYDPCTTELQVERLLNQYLALVHGLVAQAHGNVDAIVGDQLLVTFNAHLRCADAPIVAARTALEVQALAAAQPSVPLQLQIGLAEGWMYIGCGGYHAFKAMVALGSPLKVASLLAHLSTAAPAAVLTDPAMEERCRYAFRLRPVSLVFLPHLGKFLPALDRDVPIFLLEDRREFQPDEWMYEIRPTPADDWTRLFRQLRAADTPGAASALLEGYLTKHPADVHALFLQSRLGFWRPKAGVPLRERPDPFLPLEHHFFRSCPTPSRMSAPTNEPFNPSLTQ